jgi:hypothetical protein
LQAHDLEEADAMTTYRDNLRDLGYLIAEPVEPPTFTVEDDGSLIMEWEASRLAVRLTADTADGLAALVADARRKEAEAEIDDAGLWRPQRARSGPRFDDD